MNPFKFTDAINYTKEDIMIDDITEKAYNSFLINLVITFASSGLEILYFPTSSICRLLILLVIGNKYLLSDDITINNVQFFKYIFYCSINDFISSKLIPFSLN